MASATTDGILGEYYFLFILALFLVAIRTFVRFRITNHKGQGWGWDDTCIVVAWVFLLIGLILIQMEVNLGLGRHMDELDDPERNALDILKLNTFFQMDNVVCTLITKISISLFILRIRDDRRIRWTLYVFITCMTISTTAVIVVLSVSCRPLRKLWEPQIPGDCLPLATVYNVAYVQSAFTIVIDLGLSLIPIHLLWNIQIARGKKTFVCFLMTLGLIATVSNGLRNAFQGGLTSKDFTYDMKNVTIVAILELSSGIIAACIPTCVAILRIRKAERRKLTGGSQGNETGSSNLSALQRSQIHRNTVPGELALGEDDEHDLLPLRKSSLGTQGTHSEIHVSV